LGLYHQTMLPNTSDITSYQWKRPDSFPSISLIELLYHANSLSYICGRYEAKLHA